MDGALGTAVHDREHAQPRLVDRPHLLKRDAKEAPRLHVDDPAQHSLVVGGPLEGRLLLDHDRHGGDGLRHRQLGETRVHLAVVGLESLEACRHRRLRHLGGCDRPVPEGRAARRAALLGRGVGGAGDDDELGLGDLLRARLDSQGAELIDLDARRQCPSVEVVEEGWSLWSAVTAVDPSAARAGVAVEVRLGDGLGLGAKRVGVAQHVAQVRRLEDRSRVGSVRHEGVEGGEVHGGEVGGRCGLRHVDPVLGVRHPCSCVSLEEWCCSLRARA
eukprot:scaffold57191_cov64-Phaeocystis_antarctica.AAC.1